MIKKIKLILRFVFIYVPYLLIEILKSGIITSLVILFSKEQKQNVFDTIEFNTALNKKIKKVLYAASITLTPGTFTIDIKEDGKMLIHGLCCNSEKDRINIIGSLKQMENKVKSI